MFSVQERRGSILKRQFNKGDYKIPVEEAFSKKLGPTTKNQHARSGRGEESNTRTRNSKSFPVSMCSKMSSDGSLGQFAEKMKKKKQSLKQQSLAQTDEILPLSSSLQSSQRDHTSIYSDSRESFDDVEVPSHLDRNPHEMELDDFKSMDKSEATLETPTTHNQNPFCMEELRNGLYKLSAPKNRGHGCEGCSRNVDHILYGGSPGPAHYSLPSCLGRRVPDKKVTGAAIIVGRPRSPGSKFNLSPGPALYAVPSVDVYKMRLPKYSMAGAKPPPPHDYQIPSPNAYYTDKMVIGKTGSSYSFGRKHSRIVKTLVTKDDI